ncbi:RNA-directed DNA polymerase, eukaryota [Tanacetum coccineum]
MSDSKDSIVTYTAVSSPFEGLSDIGSLGVDGPPMIPEDPYAYVVAAFLSHHLLIELLALRSQSRHHFHQSLFLSLNAPGHYSAATQFGGVTDWKAPRTRTTPAKTTTTTTPMTDEQLKTLIAQGVANVLAERDATRSRNGEDNHDSSTGGTEGVVKLTQWFERTETVFRISNCTMENQIKFATCTILGSALTWWNSHIRTVGHDVAYTMTWTNLKNKMTDKYCPRGEIKKLEVEMMFPEESDKIEKYVGGLPDMIHGSVMASKPKTMQDAIEFATELIDKKISTLAERQVENKRKLDNKNQAQQQPPKKQGVAIAFIAGPGERKEYVGTLPLCNKCKFHHNGQCTVKCANCKRVGHLTRDYRSPTATNNQRNLTCYECGNQGHYRSDCLELKNQNHKNQAGGTRARGMVHALGRGETNQDLNAIEDDINA